MTTTQVLTVAEADLGRRHQIGSGGMAKVLSVPEFFVPEAAGTPQVYKKYRSRVRPVPIYGLLSLVRMYDALETKQRTAFDRCFNWPMRVVVDTADGAAGVVLPLLPDQYFLTLRLSSGSTERKPAEAQFLFMDAAYCAKVGIPFPDDQQRRQLCRSLVYAMGLLDRADVVYGDLSARNFLYTVRPRPAVKLVDCDAVRPQGARSALGSQPHSPDWEPPEAVLARRRRDAASYNIQSKATDRYKLGLAILRILTPGEGCSVNTDPERARGLLPRSLYALLERSLGPVPVDRPSAKEWYQELTR